MRHGVIITSTVQLGTPRGGMMNIAARFSLSKKPRFVDQEKKKPND
jgi:hypothetical protein